MEQIIICYSAVSGLDFRNEVIMFDYSSKEDAYVDFVSAVEKSIEEEDGFFSWMGYDHLTQDFSWFDPCSDKREFSVDGFYTVNEWFDLNKVKSRSR